jgi:hypothetical protein
MIRKSVAEILDHHVTFELEAIDRMYLNAYVPSLQTGGGVVYFLQRYLGVRVPSTMMIAPMSQRFVAAMARCAETEGVDLVTFAKDQRKDVVAQKYLAAFTADEGVLFIGKAQEKASVFRTEKRRHAGDGSSYPWIIRSTAMVNHYYVYLVDRDFGPLFIKFCSYFPYAVKVCLNGHEWLKRQLTQRGIAYEPLDNGIRSSEDAARVQRIANTLDAAKIDAVFRKWLRRLPHPFLAAHRRGLSLSALHPPGGIRLDTGPRPAAHRPRLLRRSAARESRYRASRPYAVGVQSPRESPNPRPVSHPRHHRGVLPALHVDYKKSRIKQYHKDNHALRTETTINNTYDFEIGRALRNLPALREIGFAANRRFLHVEYLSHDSFIGDDHLDTLTQPVVVDTQRAAALRLGDRRVLALMQTLCLFALSPTGFRHRNVRTHIAQFLGRAPDRYAAGHMTYDLRRLRLHELIERVPHSHRYRITALGARMAILYVRVYARGFRPAASLPTVGTHPGPHALERLDAALTKYLQEAQLAA